MGIFNKINEKSGVIVSVIVVALALFILGGDLISGGSFFSASNDVGEIAGQDISADDYSKTLDLASKAHAARAGKPATDQDMPQVHNQAWGELIYKYAYPEQFEKLGISISDDEIEEMISGKEENLHPQILQSFPDSATGKFSRDRYNQFSKSPEGQKVLENFKNDLRVERLRVKYINLFQNGIYVTKEEARRQHKDQNTKAEVKYLYVPFYSIPDDSIKVSDEDIEAYIKAHKNEFKLEDRRSIEYVTFTVAPSMEDSAQIKRELQDLVKEFKSTDQDSLFALTNSDNPTGPTLMGVGELPQELKDKVETLNKGEVYGPISDPQAKSLKIYKITDIVQDPKDTLYFASAKHILFKAENLEPAKKDSVKKKAQEVLNQLKKGADFNEMVLKYSDDPGSKGTGGEYKWFKNGDMVPTFDKAVFSVSKEGLTPNLVETRFGFHIIHVTDVKTNKKFKVTSVDKGIDPAKGRERAYQKAINFISAAKDTAAFRAAAKKDSMTIQKAQNFKAMDTYIGSLFSPRELVRWAFNDAKVEAVSPTPFDIGEDYVVAILTDKKDKGTVEVDDVRDQVKFKVMSEKKAEKIIAKLQSLSGDLQKKAQAYGPTASTGTANDVTLANASIPGVGFDPPVVGTAFGLVPGKRTVPIKGDNGVAILELVKITEAADIADYSSNKTAIQQQVKNSVMNDVDKAIRDAADIEDNRVKFY